MSPKIIVYLFVSVGSIMGAYIPILLWGAGFLSFSSLIFSSIGAVIGLMVGLRFIE